MPDRAAAPKEKKKQKQKQTTLAAFGFPIPSFRERPYVPKQYRQQTILGMQKKLADTKEA